MRKIIFTLTALLCMISLLSGCSVQILAPEDTIRAPGATGFYAGVQQALEEAVGSDIILKYPLVDGIRTAFCTRDFDNCGEIEILAFYQKKAEGSVTRINVLTQVDDKWQSIQDVDPLGNELLEVSFADLDADGSDEIVAGWQVYTSKANQLCLYKMENKALVQRAGETYSAYTICDIDGNGQKEIAVSLLDAEAKSASLTFYNFTNNQFTIFSHLMLDGNVSSYASMTTANLNATTEAVYIDAYKSADTMITELVYFQNGGLFNPFAESETRENQKTFRRLPLPSRDVNNDGYIEIPFMYGLSGYEDAGDSEKQYLTDWSYFDGKSYHTAFSAWYCREQGYYLVFDNNWSNGVTVIYDAKEGTAVFCEWDSANTRAGEEIVRITPFKATDFLASPPEDYVKLAETSDKVFAAKLGKGQSALSITVEQLRQNFKFITE